MSIEDLTLPDYLKQPLAATGQLGAHVCTFISWSPDASPCILEALGRRALVCMCAHYHC